MRWSARVRTGRYRWTLTLTRLSLWFARHGWWWLSRKAMRAATWVNRGHVGRAIRVDSLR